MVMAPSPANISPRMSPARPASSVYSRDEYGNFPQPPRQESRSASGAQAAEQIESVMQKANRMLWANGFQADVVQATRVLHYELRRQLQRNPTAKSYQEIQQFCNAVIETLATWVQQNKQLDGQLALISGSITEISSLEPEERLCVIDAKSKTEICPLKMAEFAALAAVEASTMFDPDTGKPLKSKRGGIKHQLKKLFGMSSKISADGTSRHGKDQIGNSSPSSSPSKYRSSLRPGLSALPSASLSELEEMQDDIRMDHAHFLNPYTPPRDLNKPDFKAHESERHDSMILSSPCLRSPRAVPEYVKSPDTLDAAPEIKNRLQSQAESNTVLLSMRELTSPDTTLRRCAMIYHEERGTDNIMSQLSPPQLTTLAAYTDPSSQYPSSTVDPEAERTWHHAQALARLEGGEHNADGQQQGGDQDGENNERPFSFMPDDTERIGRPLHI
ncbi:hypothetical protein HDK90DRAFT_462037 [Phyllosticta capitalensis]|uniref:Uncharacterized protein n=1 Tax=Phyllosticta capitalensis TaxID=121624 RepID=A0ABR1Z4D5_9PEZI